MERENRYVVLKRSDIEKYISDENQELLLAIDEIIDFNRHRDGKQTLKAVVVEHDWPEYEPTWEAIEKRVDNETNNLNGDE